MKAKIKLSRKGNRRVVIKMTEEQSDNLYEVLGSITKSRLQKIFKEYNVSMDIGVADAVFDELYCTLENIKEMEDDNESED